MRPGRTAGSRPAPSSASWGWNGPAIRRPMRARRRDGRRHRWFTFRASSSAASARVTGRCCAAPRGRASRPPRARRRERALDAGHQIADQTLVDAELAVGEQLHHHGAQQRVVGRAHRTAGSARSREARSGSATSQLAGADRAVISTIGLLLAHQVEQMEQRALVEAAPAQSSTTSAPVASAPSRSVSPSARAETRRAPARLGPDRRQVALARAFRADQRERAVAASRASARSARAPRHSTAGAENPRARSSPRAAARARADAGHHGRGPAPCALGGVKPTRLAAGSPV